MVIEWHTYLSKTGVIQEHPVYIPLFVDIKFNIAEGLKFGDQQKFSDVISRYEHQVNTERNRQVPGNPGNWSMHLKPRNLNLKWHKQTDHMHYKCVIQT